MLDCEQALELISAKLDGALTAEESAQLEEHLAACPACRALLADFEELHMELPRLAAQPPADLKDHIMAEVRRSKVTPFQGKKKQWRWRSLASLAAVLVLVLVGSNALRQWDGAASRTAQAPAAGEVAADQEADNPAPAAIAPEEQEETGSGEKSGRNLEDSGGPAVQEKTGEAESTAPLPTTAPAQTAAPAGEPNTYAVRPETRTNSAGLTQDEALRKLALYLGWPADSLTADSSGVLTGPVGDDGVKRTITCTGLNEAGTGWVCQVEEAAPGGPDASVSCTTYTVPLDGSEITQP